MKMTETNHNPFEELQADFYHYLREQVGLARHTCGDYVSRMRFLSQHYTFDESFTAQDIEKILQEEDQRRLSRSRYSTPKAISDFSSCLKRFHGFVHSNYQQQQEQQTLHQIELVQNDTHLTPTEKETLIRSRVGQGQFRKALIDYWQGCSLTTCQLMPCLVASHIKPWKDSNNTERLDPYNGLLLLPNYDKLFDLGYITFLPSDGAIRVSKHLDPSEHNRLGLSKTLHLQRLDPPHRHYLEYHLTHQFLG